MSEDFVYQGEMTSELRAYLDHDAKKDGDYQESRRLRALIQPEVLNAYSKASKERYFTPEREKAGEEHLSPTGKYKLVVSNYETSKGSWSYSGGKVYEVGSDQPIADIHRNYSAFPFLFVEGHEKGDFLIAGEDYQGQTVIDLKTGQRRDHLSDGTDKGHGFCWGDYEYEASAKVLVVDGCIWACPYEFRLYDFSDPMKGWPELETEKCIYADKMKPTFESDGTIKFYETDASDDDDEDDEGNAPPTRPLVIASFKGYIRAGLKLIEVEEWVSEAEKERRHQREEGRRKYEAWRTDFIATDPLYLTYSKLVKDPELSPDDYMSTGVTHDRWCPHWKGDESRWCRRIITHKGKKGWTVDLEWAVKTGPIKLDIYLDGNTFEQKFFEHSAEDMQAAFAYAKALISKPETLLQTLKTKLGLSP